MKHFDYTKKEFSEKYDYRWIKDFFKHPDRKESLLEKRPDFYRFWGIEKKSVMDREDHRVYEIPVEASSLYSELIRLYGMACGVDRRGQSKGNLRYSVSKYQDYLNELEYMLNDKLEPYQSCLIKNFESYDMAGIFALFLPMLLERIAILLAVIIENESDNSNDTYYITIEQIDMLIEEIIAKRVGAQESRFHNPNLYSFENAISGAFEVLTTDKEPKSTKGKVHSQDLEKEILRARLDFRERIKNKNIDADDKEEIAKLRQKLVDTLNEVTQPFSVEQRSQKELINRNVQEIVSELNDFWNKDSCISRQERGAVDQYYRNLVGFIDFLSESRMPVNGIRELLKKDTIQHIEDGDFIKAEECCSVLSRFEEFEDELEMIEERDPQNEDEWLKLIRECVSNKRDLFQSGTLQYGKNRSAIRQETCEQYHKVRNSGAYVELYAALEDAVGRWLPDQLLKKN